MPFLGNVLFEKRYSLTYL